jgi:flagellar basal-body rod protein FlgF
MSDPRVLSASQRAMRFLEVRQGVMANNLANLSTPGFQAQRVFGDLATDGLGPVANQSVDLRPGPVIPTNRSLDLALDGPGFLVVDTPNGERLIRAGALRLDQEGRLIDPKGHQVLGVDGPLLLPPGSVVIGERGEIHVDGTFIDRLRVESPLDPRAVQREAGGLRLAQGGTMQAGPETVIRQGYLEESNVSPVQAMTEMIEIQRAYSQVQRSVGVLDGVLERLANDVGRVR